MAPILQMRISRIRGFIDLPKVTQLGRESQDFTKLANIWEVFPPGPGNSRHSINASQCFRQYLQLDLPGYRARGALGALRVHLGTCLVVQSPLGLRVLQSKNRVWLA